MGVLFWSWWHYYFAPSGEPWWMGGVWGNVFAILPLFGLGAVGFAWHHLILRRLHRLHAAHLCAILDALDPDTEGGIADVHDRLAAIEAKLDPETEGGLRVVIDRVTELLSRDQPGFRNADSRAHDSATE